MWRAAILQLTDKFKDIVREMRGKALGLWAMCSLEVSSEVTEVFSWLEILVIAPIYDSLPRRRPRNVQSG